MTIPLQKYRKLIAYCVAFVTLVTAGCCLFYASALYDAEASHKAEIEAISDENAELRTTLEETQALLTGANLASESASETEEAEAYEYAEFGYDYSYVYRVVGAECRGESELGIMAVCQCIAYTAEKYGITPEQVVKQPGQYTSPMPTEFFSNGETVNECCLRVFAAGEIAVNDDIQYFCTNGSGSAFHSGLRKVCTIGNHTFYAED